MAFPISLEVYAKLANAKHIELNKTVQLSLDTPIIIKFLSILFSGPAVLLLPAVRLLMFLSKVRWYAYYIGPSIRYSRVSLYKFY